MKKKKFLKNGFTHIKEAVQSI